MVKNIIMKLFFSVFLIIGCNINLYASPLDLTPEEKAFIADHEELAVSNELDFPPYNYNDRGVPKGFSIDYFRLVAEKAGLKYRFVSGPSWNGFMDMIRKNDIDVMLNIMNTPERRSYIHFTKSYAVAIPVLVVREDNQHLENLREMSGMTVAVPKGFNTTEMLKAIYPEIKRLETNDILGSLEAVKFGHADAAVADMSVADFLIEKNTITGLVTRSKIKDPAFASIMNFGISENKPILRDILQKAMDAVTDEEIFAMREKWLYRANDRTEPEVLTLSDTEVNYLKKRDEITFCIDPFWMPFEGYNNEEKYSGISSDYVEMFSKKLDKPFRLIETKTWTESTEMAQQKKCDILPLLGATPERVHYLNFTKPYFSTPVVLVTRLEAAFVPDMNGLRKEVGVVEGYTLVGVIKGLYPNLKVREVPTLHAGLEMVKDKKLFGMVASLPPIGYEIQDHFLGQLKVAGRFEEPMQLGVGVRKDDPILLGILNKVIDSVSDREHRSIVNSWMVISYKQGIDFKLFAEIIVIFLIISAFLVYRQHQLKTLNQKLAYLSVTDKLTQLYNRIKLDYELEILWKEFTISGNAFSVIIIDADHFKSINDNYGHLTGDAILEELADVFTGMIRSSDIIGRWGGEEFMILCPETDRDGAMCLAEKIRNKANESSFAEEIKITVSIGVAEIEKGESIDDMIKRADEALYNAKEAGRNCTAAS